MEPSILKMNNLIDRLNFTVKVVDWATAEQQIRPVREIVFIQEQLVPTELEWDGLDAESTHILSLLDDGTPVGTARLLTNGHIGRMAVLNPYRNYGIGSAMLNALLAYAREHQINDLFLYAQTQAVSFYEQHEFTAIGDIFIDAGIPHQKMFYNQNHQSG